MAASDFALLENFRSIKRVVILTYIILRSSVSYNQIACGLLSLSKSASVSVVQVYDPPNSIYATFISLGGQT